MARKMSLLVEPYAPVSASIDPFIVVPSINVIIASAPTHASPRPSRRFKPVDPSARAHIHAMDITGQTLIVEPDMDADAEEPTPPDP